MSLIQLENICVEYGKRDHTVHALKRVNFSVEEGEFVAIMGKSGCGKTTFLNVLGTLLAPKEGSYIFNESSVLDMNERQKALFRNKNIGFVVQHFALVSDMTIFENVALPLTYRRLSRIEVRKRVEKILTELDIIDQKNKYPHELSGGQNQRAAIARAIVTNPKLILADEPTGALDEENGNLIMDILEQFHQKGVTIIMVTHDVDLANRASRIVHIREGKMKDPNPL